MADDANDLAQELAGLHKTMQELQTQSAQLVRLSEAKKRVFDTLELRPYMDVIFSVAGLGKTDILELFISVMPINSNSDQ